MPLKHRGGQSQSGPHEYFGVATIRGLAVEQALALFTLTDSYILRGRALRYSWLTPRYSASSPSLPHTTLLHPLSCPAMVLRVPCTSPRLAVG